MPPKKPVVSRGSKVTAKPGGSREQTGTKKAGAGVKAAGASGAGAKKKGTTANTSNKSKTQGQKEEKKWTAEDDAARKIQTAIRGYLARKQLAKLRKEKVEYEELMDELEKQAFIQLVKMQQYEIEMQRKKEEEERRRRREDMKRRKRMLEAAFEGDNNTIEAILKQVTDCDDKEGLETEGLGYIVRKRHLLDMVDCEDPNGNTPLSEASSGGHVDTIRYLVEKGAVPNSRGHFNRTPLYRAAFAGHLEAVQTLLELGADPRLYADDGQVPSQVASTDEVREYLENWDVEQTDLLLEKLDEEKQIRAEEELKRREAEVLQMEEQVRQAERDYQVSQKKKEDLNYGYGMPGMDDGLGGMGNLWGTLSRATDELNRLIEEHDLAVASGFQNAELLVQAIHDGELTLETAKIDAEKAKDHLSIVRLQLRNSNETDDDQLPGVKINIKELDDVLLRDVGNKIADSGKWPLVIDPSQQAATFLRYRDTNYINALSPRTMEKERIRMSLIGSLRYGKPLVVDMMAADIFDQVCIRFDEVQDGLIKSIMDKSIMNEEKWEKLLREDDGEEYVRKKFNNMRVRNFKFFLITQCVVPREELINKFYVIRVKVN